MVLLKNIISNNKSESWVSVYLYYNDPLDDFLKYAVTPFVKNALNQQLAEHFFFIRYWDHGPHIRLRLICNSDKKKLVLKNSIRIYFEEYFLKHPSFRDDRLYSKNVRDTLISNNSIRFIQYKPELRRYGGKIGVAIAEKQFEISSSTVISILQEVQQWNNDRALGAAIEMHLLMLLALSLSKQNMIEFFDFIYKSYLIDSGNIDINFLTKDQLHEYENIFQSQKNILIPYVHNFIEIIQNNINQVKPWMKMWYLAMQDVGNYLKDAQKRKLLHRFRYFFKSSHDLWILYYSYIHMNNNRLGIHVKEEPYLAYILKRALENV
jgi:thiopeptide-type bacteriocin biosynthesis protein